VPLILSKITSWRYLCWTYNWKN